jgi:hypothetical protein
MILNARVRKTAAIFSALLLVPIFYSTAVAVDPECSPTSDSSSVAAIANTAKSCSYRPSNRGNISLSVTLAPTDGGISTVTTQIGSYFVYARSGSR